MDGEQEWSIQDLGRRLEGRRPLQRPRHRWEDNIKIDLQDVEWGGMDWIVVSQGRNEMSELVRVENEPSGSIK
jgi:hypothetical protein